MQKNVSSMYVNYTAEVHVLTECTERTTKCVIGTISRHTVLYCWLQLDHSTVTVLVSAVFRNSFKGMGGGGGKVKVSRNKVGQT